jgi:O-methyltransferase
MNPLKQALKYLISCLGYDVRKLSSQPVSGVKSRRQLYSTISPVATYSPWNVDTEFQRIYQSIKSNTLVDEYRCYELWQLVKQSAKLDTGSIIEIGVWRGGTGALIAQSAIQHGINEKVYLCDTFQGVVKAGSKDSDYRGGEHSDTSKHTVEDLVHHKLKLHNAMILEGVFPDESCHTVDGKVFRLCHIDVDVYQSAKDIVDWIWDKLVPGGIIVYDDYGFCGCDGITKHVDEQCDFVDRLCIHNLNGHAIMIKR